MKRPLALIFLLSTLLSLATPCIHEEFKKEVLPFPETLLDVTSSEDRMLATGTDSIRIVAYYFLDGFSTRIQTAISEQIIPAAIAYYEATLEVKQLTSPILLASYYTQYCAEVDPTSDMPSSVSADLVLLVTATADTNSNYIAAASACWTGGSTGRPIMGHIRFNTAYGFADDTEFNFRSQIYTTLHEMGHILGFSSGLYEKFIDPDTGKLLGEENVYKTKTVNGVPQIVLTMEPLVTKVQEYFDCTTLDGAYIEQQGGSGSAGSHFERRVFMNEFMTASSTIDSRISEIFLALLEGTGWYYPKYEMAEPMFWGKDKGCAFLDTKCIISKDTDFPDHFCTKLDVDSCTFSNEAYGVCGNTDKTKTSSSLNSNWNYFGSNIVVLDSFADNCPYYYSYSLTECQDSSNSAINLAGGEYFGEGSSCFTGTLGNSGTKSTKAPFCLKYTCSEVSANTYNIIVTVGSESVTCTKAESISVPGYYGALNCPNPNTFCTTSGSTYCPRGCMGRGTCDTATGVCVCDGDYTGADCSQSGTMTFSEKKDVYSVDFGETASSPSSSSSKIVIYAAVGAGAAIIIAVVAFVVARYRRAKLRKAAERRREERRQNRQSGQNRRNNYAVNEGQAPVQQQQGTYVDPRGINVGIVQQQPIQMYVMPQQQNYANNVNPQMMQMQGNMVYYPEANVYQDQNGNIYPAVPLQNGHPQQQQGHAVQIPH